MNIRPERTLSLPPFPVSKKFLTETTTEGTRSRATFINHDGDGFGNFKFLLTS